MSTNKAALLLFLSEYKQNSEEVSYRLADDNTVEYKGAQTYEAPIKHLLKTIKDDGRSLAKILVITSHDVKTKPESKSQYERFKDTIRNEVNECCENMFIEIPYDYDSETGEPCDYGTGLALEIYKHLASGMGSEALSVYIDYTGGMRDISFLMTSIIKYLEFQGHSCGKIVYAKRDSKENNNYIYELDYIYDMYQLINAVQQFLDTGNAYLLDKFYGKDAKEAAVIRAIIDFSDAMGVCAVGEIEKEKEKLEKAIRELENRTISDDDLIYNRMFRQMLEIIREKMKINNNGNISYPDMIKWCLDNRMIQQAVTLFIEKMPQVYFEKFAFLNTIVDPQNVQASMSGDNYSTAFYTNLFDSVIIRPKSILQPLLNEVQVIIDNNNDDNTVLYTALSNGNPFDSDKKPELNAAWIRLCDTLSSKYINGNAIDIYGVGIAQKSIKAFINTAGNNSRILHYFLRNNENEYESKYKKYDKAETLEKKKIVLGNISDSSFEDVHKAISGNDEKRKLLHDMLAYYCALKIVRNRMNHASENTETNDEKELREYIENYKFKDGSVIISNKLSDIGDIILKGIALLENDIIP